MPEVQSLVSDPKVHSIDGPMCRWSLKARGSNEKVEFARKQTRWITSSKEIVEVLRGDRPWKCDRRHVHMTGKSETACEYLASLVVAMLSVIKRQMISDGVIRVGELRFAGPVPDEGGCPTELEGKWRDDGIWIDPKLLIAGRKEEMEYMRKMGVFNVVDEKERYDNGCKLLKLKWVDEMKGEKCRSRLVCREIKWAKYRDEQLGPEDVFSPMPPSEGLKMLVSTMMTGHDDGNHAYGEARRWIYTYLPEGHEQVGVWMATNLVAVGSIWCTSKETSTVIQQGFASKELVSAPCMWVGLAPCGFAVGSSMASAGGARGRQVASAVALVFLGLG